VGGKIFRGKSTDLSKLSDWLKIKTHLPKTRCNVGAGIHKRALGLKTDDVSREDLDGS